MGQAKALDLSRAARHTEHLFEQMMGRLCNVEDGVTRVLQQQSQWQKSQSAQCLSPLSLTSLAGPRPSTRGHKIKSWELMPTQIEQDELPLHSQSKDAPLDPKFPAGLDPG